MHHAYSAVEDACMHMENHDPQHHQLGKCTVYTFQGKSHVQLLRQLSMQKWQYACMIVYKWTVFEPVYTKLVQPAIEKDHACAFQRGKICMNYNLIC